MRSYLLLSVLLCFLLGCTKAVNVTKSPTFNITNSSSGIISQVTIKLESNGAKLDAIAIADLGINKKETKVINLSGYNLKGDAGYLATITLSNGNKLEKSFGYITNGVDINANPYNIEVSNSDIIIK
jgi:hypothetical protein